MVKVNVMRLRTTLKAIHDVASQAGLSSVLIEIGDRQLAPENLLSNGYEQFALHCMRITRDRRASA